MRDDVIQVLGSATLAEPASTAELDRLLTEPDGLAGPVTEALEGVEADDVQRLIPLLALAAAIVDEPDPFQEHLDHPDSTVRLVAARALAQRGDPRGLPALVELLEDEHHDRSGRSPVPVWAVASLALGRLTGEVLGPPLDADAYTRTRARRRWAALLSERDLVWSPERGEWD